RRERKQRAVALATRLVAPVMVAEADDGRVPDARLRTGDLAQQLDHRLGVLSPGLVLHARHEIGHRDVHGLELRFALRHGYIIASEAARLRRPLPAPPDP